MSTLAILKNFIRRLFFCQPYCIPGWDLTSFINSIAYYISICLNVIHLLRAKFFLPDIKQERHKAFVSDIAYVVTLLK